jgi:hypothetical protein
MFDCNYAVVESVVSRANQDGTVVIMKMDEGNVFFKINGVAAEVWRELSIQKNITEITQNIILSYNESEEKIISDVKFFLETLMTKELIKKV